MGRLSFLIKNALFSSGENFSVKEGTVRKIYPKKGRTVFFKEKWERPSLIPTSESHDSSLPRLPESEIWGALDKVHADLSDEDFKNIRIAMPLFVKYVGEECKKHKCYKPKGSLFRYYTEQFKENL